MHFITKCDTKLITLVNLHLLQILWHTFKSFLLLQNNSINRPSSLCDQLKLIDLNRVNLSPGFNFAENAVGWGMLRNEQQIWFARRPSIPFSLSCWLDYRARDAIARRLPRVQCLNRTPATNHYYRKETLCLSVCLSAYLLVCLSVCIYVCLLCVCLVTLFLCFFVCLELMLWTLCFSF